MNALTNSAELSPRLRQVLLLLEQGCLYKEIADRLGISNHTVKNYCEKLYRKFGVHSARQAVYFYRAPLKRTPGLKLVAIPASHHTAAQSVSHNPGSTR